MRFETLKDLQNEYEAISIFCDEYELSCRKLDENDIDFELLKDERIIGYAEVKGRNKTIEEAYPLPIAVRKLVKLMDKKTKPVIIWKCYDGIIYGKLEKLKGQIRIGGRKPRENSFNDIELMAYFERSKELIEKKI
jgi:hypothetical protein